MPSKVLTHWFRGVRWKSCTTSITRCLTAPLQTTLLPHACMQTSIFSGFQCSVSFSSRIAASFSTVDIQVEVGASLDGSLVGDDDWDHLLSTLSQDMQSATQHIALHLLKQQGDDDKEGNRVDDPPGPFEVSLVLCDDPCIRELNKEWRGKDAATDVLSFEMNNEDDVELPMSVLGDVIISKDTAARQAEERGHTLLDECRILLLHGLLHLFGYDHETGDNDANEMAQAERKIMKRLGWKGDGLIESVSCPTILTLPCGLSTTDIRLVAIDMDGTLLNSKSEVLSSSATAIKSALKKGVRIFVATGKARPAAEAALSRVGLAGSGLLVDPSGPGVYIQGLVTYGLEGKLVAGAHLPPEIIESAYMYAHAHNLAVVGFLGEECITPRMTPEVEELHRRYYEPLALVVPSVKDVLLEHQPVRKMLFMSTADIVKEKLWPHWAAALAEGPAAPMQAVPEMLEIVPRGWNKWRALTALLAAANLPRSALAAIGDGSNDLEMVRESGVGIAMGNAVSEVKKAAKVTVSSNDENGIEEALDILGLL